MTVREHSSRFRKFDRSLDLINTRRELGFASATNAFVSRRSSASQCLPSLGDDEWAPFTPGGFSFGETLGDWFAFQGDLLSPVSYDPLAHFLVFEFSIRRNYLVRTWDDDFPAGPEGRFWINGKVVSAIDQFHLGAVIHELGHTEVRIFTGRCRSCHGLNRFGVSLLDRQTEILYQRIRFLVSLIKELKPENLSRSLLIEIVDDTLRRLDFLDPSFYQSVPQALACLEQRLAQLPGSLNKGPGVSIIASSHIDTCWLWPFSLTRFKVANTFASILHLIESRTPIQWKFFATSAQHYKWLKDDCPEIYERVVAAIANGRWEANGAMWVEPDTNLPNGESLLRQLALGIRFFERELGVKQTVAILPDSFGFNANLPQILKHCGISNFLTSKISWSEYTEFPHSSFVWRGIDGSEVLAHFITSPSPKGGFKSTYAGTATPGEIIGTYDAYKQKDDLHASALHVVGHGDGGGGVTQEMIWNLEVMNELPALQNVPHLRFPTLTQLFDELHAVWNSLPVWDDELYLEAHRGTFTSQEEVKRLNRQLECCLHNVEWLEVIAMSLCGLDLREITKEVDCIWEDVLLFQFHDAIPGSSLNEVNIDIIGRGRGQLGRLVELQGQLTKTLVAHMDIDNPKSLVLFNTLGHRRIITGQSIPSGGWTVKNSFTQLLRDDQETEIYERIMPGDTFRVHRLTSQLIDSSVAPFVSDHIAINAKTGAVTTPFFVARFSPGGALYSVRDLSTGREYLSGDGNQFELYEDRPFAWPAWDIQLYHKEMQITPPHCESIDFLRDRIVIKYVFDKIGVDESRIVQTVTFSADSPIIDFKTVVNWRVHDKLLKVAFPTTVRSRSARFGIQFGHIQRPTHVNTERDLAKFEVPGRWADLSDSSGGISICSDVKSGFDVHESVIRMSLLKAPLQTDKWADFGLRKFTYRLYFHTTAFVESQSVNFADELNVPIIVHSVEVPRRGGILPVTADFVVLDSPHVVLETLVLAHEGEGFIARFYESNGGWCRTTVHFPLLNESEWNVAFVDALERPVSGNVHRRDVPELSFDLALTAFEIRTVCARRRVIQSDR